MRIRTNVKVALVASLLALAYLAVILFNEGLRRDYFLQRVTGVVLTLWVTVVLFALFHQETKLRMKAPRVPVGVEWAHAPEPWEMEKRGVWDQIQPYVLAFGSAAAFFLWVLPSISSVLFPANISVAGNIYYTATAPAEAGLVPVPGALVTVPETNQQSEPTNQQGRFTIANISFQPRELDVFYSGRTYTTPLSDRQRYPIIPAPAPTPPVPEVLSANEWIENPVEKCPAPPAGVKGKPKYFFLERSFKRLAGDRLLHVEMTLQDDAQRLTHVQELKPGWGMEKPETDPAHRRTWEIALKNEETEVRLYACIGAVRAGVAPSRVNLRTRYWFSK